MNRPFVGTLAILLATAAAGGAALAFKRADATTTMTAGLEWSNGLKNAQSEAVRTGKPILLLSMFGRIDEDMPCANARTMRAALFPTKEFQALANNDVILAWEMVRAVPKVTIEIDGRTVQRTVRGNAVFYLCNADGKVMDAFPGQYTKEDFLPAIRQSLKDVAGKSEAEVIAAHRKIGSELVIQSIRATTSKMAVESPTLALMAGRTPEQSNRKGEVQSIRSTDELRQRYEEAADQVIDSSLQPASPRTVVASTLGAGSQLTPAQLGEAIRRRDSANNIQAIRPIIHLWLGTVDRLPTPMEARNDVLKRILKVPYDDPNWGLGDIEIPGTPAPAKPN